MAFVPVPNAARVELRFTAQNEMALNTLWFSHGDTLPNHADLKVLTDFVLDWWTGHMRPLSAVSLVLREVYAQTQDGSGLEFTSVPDPLTNAGTLESEAMPNNVTMCVSFRTGLAGRSYRGRNFVAGQTISGTTGNFFESIFAADVVEAYTHILDDITSTEWVWGVASRFNNKAPRPEGVVTPITAVMVTDLAVDSQRRRLFGRGR